MLSRRDFLKSLLFDSGSQRSYISDRITNFLNLQAEETETISICTFGNKETSSKEVKNVSFYLIDSNKEKLPITAISYPVICLPIRNQKVEGAQKTF